MWQPLLVYKNWFFAQATAKANRIKEILSIKTVTNPGGLAGDRYQIFWKRSKMRMCSSAVAFTPKPPRARAFLPNSLE